MSQDDLFGAPAGWYPDPLGLPQLRWWNNHAWTEQTSAARQPMVVQDTKFAWADEELPTRRHEREREREQSSDIRTPVEEAAPSADSLRELEPPRAFAKVEQASPDGAAASASAGTTTEAPAENKWWSAPRATEDRRAAAAARQAAAAQAAAIRAAAAQAAAEKVAAEQTAAATATAATVPGAEVPVADLFDSHYFANPTAPATSATPVVEEEPVSIADIFGAHYFSTPTAPATAAPSFSGLFDTAAPLAPADGALDDIFGASAGTRTDARGRRPIISADLADRANPIIVRDKVSANTGVSWVIGALPIAQLVVALLLVTSLGGTTDLSTIFLALLVVPYLVSVALAYVDYRTLLRAGLERPAHWAFAFLTAPIYLVLRARATLRETGHGVGPILVWLALGVLTLVSLVAIPGILISALPNVFIAQAEQSAEQSAQQIAATDVTVDCAKVIPPVIAGQEITCATITNGTFSTVVIALQRSNGWIAWQPVSWGKYGING